MSRKRPSAQALEAFEKAMRSSTTENVFLQPLSLAQRRLARSKGKIDHLDRYGMQPMVRKRRRKDKEEKDEKDGMDPATTAEIEREIQKWMGMDVLEEDGSIGVKNLPVTPEQIDGLFPKQRKVYDWCMVPNGKNLFFTGKAGTGKTHTMKTIVQQLRHVSSFVSVCFSDAGLCMRCAGICTQNRSSPAVPRELPHNKFRGVRPFTRAFVSFRRLKTPSVLMRLQTQSRG